MGIMSSGHYLLTKLTNKQKTSRLYKRVLKMRFYILGVAKNIVNDI